MARVTTALVADRVRLLLRQMKEEGRTQTEAAVEAGIGETVASKLLKDGSIKEVDLDTVTKVIDRLRIDPSFFF